MRKLGVVVFPGSNCDHDLYHALKHVLRQNVRFVWHKETDISDLRAVFLPGGFSYGDYLRGGAIARFSPVMREIVKFAKDGGTVVGICNGFQVLCETGLLPGSLMRNKGLDFVCRQVNIRVENSASPFTRACDSGQVLKMPVAHGEGNYYAEQNVIDDLEAGDQILFRYCSSNGDANEDSNPNGSLKNIAGITNKAGNVLGMMPHPERACEEMLGSADGALVFTSLLELELAA